MIKIEQECTGYNRWSKVTDLSKRSWELSFVKLKFSTHDSKLRWLQFRILHNILTTNRSVSKYKENSSRLVRNHKRIFFSIQNLLTNELVRMLCYLYYIRVRLSDTIFCPFPISSAISAIYKKFFGFTLECLKKFYKHDRIFIQRWHHMVI